jgi:hypothetical protein
MMDLLNKKEKTSCLLFLIFTFFAAQNSFSQGQPEFYSFNKKNFLTEFLVSSSGFSMRDSVNLRKNNYAYLIAFYSRTGYFVVEKLNTGIALDVGISRSNFLPSIPPTYLVGLFSRYYFFTLKKTTLFGELSSGLTNACYIKPNPIPGFPGFQDGITVKKVPITFIRPTIGLNFNFKKNFFFAFLLSKYYLIEYSECNRSPLGAAFGITYFFNPAKKSRNDL